MARSDHENISIDIDSHANLACPEALAAIGTALDTDPRLAPERMGPRDPARTPVTSVREYLAAWNPPQRRGHRDDQFMVRKTEPIGLGTLSLSFAPWPRTINFSYDERGFATTGELDALAALFGRLCEAMDASYGNAAYNPVRRQEVAFRERSRKRGGPPRDWSRPYFVDEHALADVYWLNYFGPSFLAKWGEGRLDGLGVRQATTSNGGRIIWATETPFVLDPAATAMTGYAWKRPFYDALGLDTFRHERWEDPGVGIHVPSYEEHRAAVTRYREDAP